MAEEKYKESIIMRLDNMPEVEEPTLSDTQVDTVFEFEGTVKLVQIIKNVSNATHNKHDYVFKITDIQKIQEIIE